MEFIASSATSSTGGAPCFCSAHTAINRVMIKIANKMAHLFISLFFQSRSETQAVIRGRYWGKINGMKATPESVLYNRPEIVYNWQEVTCSFPPSLIDGYCPSNQVVPKALPDLICFLLNTRKTRLCAHLFRQLKNSRHNFVYLTCTI